jgi:hypothetical protein
MNIGGWHSMKIDGNDETVKRLYSDKLDKDNSKGDVAFADILMEKIEIPRSQCNGTPSPPLAVSLHPVQMTAISTENRSMMMERLSSLLDLLGEYRDQLAHPAISLKDIHPVVTAIEKQTQKLEADLELLAENDELKKILNQTLVTASMEVIKFNRGDYVPA